MFERYLIMCYWQNLKLTAKNEAETQFGKAPKSKESSAKSEVQNLIKQ